ncbi:glycosyltransferase [Paenibacillus sp. UMB4589-SE434]|uniref:glycosyltransferase family 2 protein n=1 Tax=Paenibacillus sp. UMB4589-SE434 TaxID=3046314 RepID=UPI00254C0BC9|nr:glycosyltransferase [Paenibacillus sp. UMB4589-SE434]MDK8183528.1 glycosyltransferase [Paenibacillus sp. UMB4589-SE434]
MDNLIATQILEMLQTGYEGIQYLEDCIQQGELNLSNITVFNNIVELVDILESVTADVSVPHRVKEINANIRYYIEKMKQDITDDNVNLFLYDFKFHFCSLFRVLEFEIAYIVENLVDKHTYPRFFPEVGTIDNDDIASQGEKALCKVSVILLAYNNLEYTQQCVESILLNTDNVEYELILVNNGSTDGTKQYFDSISGAKVIHLEYNIHLVKGFNMGLMAAEGKYCAAVCNDFIFTPNWLSNLMICIESDSRIGFVSPGATSITNMQQISIPFNSIEEFQEEAREYNVSDPSKWEERVVLLPNVLCCPTALLDRIGYYDTRYYRGEFLDDDISFRIRRAGYKLVYCADTVTHHYGSITTASDHQTNSMEEGRKTFVDRYGLDAWLDARMNLAYLNLDFSKLSDVKTILGIDVKCGATLLQISNEIWSRFGIRPELSICTTEDKYVTDIKSIAGSASVIDSFKHIPEEFNGKMDLVFVEKPLDCYEDDLEIMFSRLAQVMSATGKIIFMVNNSISIEALFEMLNASPSLHNRKIYIRDLICSHSRLHGFEPSSIINIVPTRSAESNQTIKDIAQFLAGGKESETKYVESLLYTNFVLYQMSYKQY